MGQRRKLMNVSQTITNKDGMDRIDLKSRIGYRRREVSTAAGSRLSSTRASIFTPKTSVGFMSEGIKSETPKIMNLRAR